MAATHGQPIPSVDPMSSSLEERLERGEVVFYPTCPFALPEGEDRRFLLAQQLASRAHKNVSYDPHSGKAAGFLNQSPQQAQRLRAMLATFAASATGWLTRTLPRYAKSWQLDRVSFRPVEEATRRLRLKARNDLLHVDAFPNRPSQGWRILRVFANVNLTDPRVWATSEPFAKLLARFGAAAGLPDGEGPGFVQQLGKGLLGLFNPRKAKRSVYDEFMLRFHDFLKANEAFQERGPKKFWSFPPGSAWMCMTDTCSHAALRGRYALEHSYFIAPESLALPAESPPALLEKACGVPVLSRAA